MKYPPHYVYYHGEPVNLPIGFERVTMHSPHNDEETNMEYNAF